MKLFYALYQKYFLRPDEQYCQANIVSAYYVLYLNTFCCDLSLCLCVRKYSILQYVLTFLAQQLSAIRLIGIFHKINAINFFQQKCSDRKKNYLHLISIPNQNLFKGANVFKSEAMIYIYNYTQAGSKFTNLSRFAGDEKKLSRDMECIH